MSTKTVLIADDTAYVRDRFGAALEDAGHRALLADSATTLFALIRRATGPIDLLLLDLRLSGQQGVELVRHVRQLDEGRIPILVFSGTIVSAIEVRGLAALGVAGYVNEYCGTAHILPALAPYLFPDSFNRRSSPRVILSVAASYRVGNAIASGLTLNVSRGGLAIRTITPLSPETKLRVKFRLPGFDREIEAEARVAWSDQRIGMGLQLERIQPELQRQLDEFVDTHFFSNRRG